MAAWTAVDAQLSPVIGRGGVAALYRRCLHLARADHPWLAAAWDGAVTPGDFSSLHGALARQEAAVAAAAHDTMLRTLYDLLATLIGPSLTTRLLLSASAFPTAGPAVQDPSP